MNKLKATILVGIAGSLPLFASAPAQAAAPPCAIAYNRAGLLALGMTGCSVGDKTYYDFNLPNTSAGTNPWNSALFIINNLNAENHAFQATNIGAAVTPTNTTDLKITYSYKVKIDPLGAKYLAFTSAATVQKQQPSSSVMPEYMGMLSATKLDPPVGLVGTATYTESSPSTGVMFMPPTYDGRLQFSGEIVLKKNALLSQFTDTLTQTVVPGPLPVVGAAAAFGFSRRLRKRVKAMA